MTVKQRQNLLAYLGYYNGTIDGSWGVGSIQACKTFQQKSGLTVDGICGSATEGKLIEAVSSGKFATGANTTTATTSTVTSNTTSKSTTGTFWDAIQHFSRDEFKCQCGGKYCNGYPGEPSQQLVEIAEDVREHFGGKTITVSSGMRCTKHNAAVGGVSNSRHNPEVWNGVGKAMDFCVAGVSGATVNAYCQTLVKAGKLRYSYVITDNYVHMDVQ